VSRPSTWLVVLAEDGRAHVVRKTAAAVLGSLGFRTEEHATRLAEKVNAERELSERRGKVA